MRSLIAAAVAALALVAAATFSQARPLASVDAECGVERWPVKTLTDTATTDVDLADPKDRTVEELRRLKVPKTWTKKAPRIPPVETSTYRVKVLLMSMKREDDSDVHLVIADPRVGGSMIVEFPAFACTVGAPSEARTLMQDARKALADACDGEPPKKFVTLSGKATITGVGFFDAIHGQGGVAPNGIELHPVIEFTSSSCTRIKNP